MADDCCKSGFQWQGTPAGKEATLGALPAYVVGDSPERAILLVADLYGWTLTNARLLADHLARATRSTVYIPDFFGGEVVDPTTMETPPKRAAFDLPAFLARNSKATRWPEVLAAARELRGGHAAVGAVGYCWGGWACARLGAERGLLRALAVAHPSLLERGEIDGLAAPTLVVAPEHDVAFSPELKAHANATIPALGIDYAYAFFAGQSHGFASRANPLSDGERSAMERACNMTAQWFVEHLH